MDIQRDPPRSHRRMLVVVGAVTVLIGATVALTRLRSAVPTVERSLLTIDVVSRGEVVRDVRASGSLVADNIRILVASTGGRVEGEPVSVGSHVEPGTVIVRLANPDVDLAALQVEQQIALTATGLAQLRSRLSQDDASQRAAMLQLRSQLMEAQRNSRTLDSFDRRGLASRNEVASAHERAEELGSRMQIEQGRLASMRRAATDQVRLTEQQMVGLRRMLAEQRRRVVALQVVAGQTGQLQSLGTPRLELGQWVNAGAELARVADPGRMRAQLRVPDLQAREVSVGQNVVVDLHDGVMPGLVTGIDPVSRAGSVMVDIRLVGSLPRSARPDLAIDGAIELERLPDVLRLSRPAYGAQRGKTQLFRLIPNQREAQRVDVELGRGSVTTVEVLRGLAPGDSVIVSDVSYLTDSHIRIRP